MLAHVYNVNVDINWQLIRHVNWNFVKTQAKTTYVINAQ